MGWRTIEKNVSQTCEDKEIYFIGWYLKKPEDQFISYYSIYFEEKYCIQCTIYKILTRVYNGYTHTYIC